MELVSIIIPVYNTGEPMRACLDSVLAQTYTNLEILLVDDHSTDPLTLEILKEYSQKDSRIKVNLNSENHGVSYCRNKGIDLCFGKFLSFLDSDDQFVPDFVERLYRAVSENQTDFAVADIKQVAYDNSVSLVDDIIFPLSETNRVEISKFLSDGLLFKVPVTPCAKLINVEKLKQSQLYFDEKLRYSEDNDWMIRIFLSLKSFSVVKFFGIRRMLISSSLTHTISEDRLMCGIYSVELNFKALQEHGWLEHYWAYFINHCFCILNHSLMITDSDEIRQRFLQAAHERYALMGIEVNVNPSFLYVLWNLIKYKTFKLLHINHLKIRSKAIYKFSSNLRKML